MAENESRLTRLTVVVVVIAIIVNSDWRENIIAITIFVNTNRTTSYLTV